MCEENTWSGYPLSRRPEECGIEKTQWDIERLKVRYDLEVIR